MANDDLLKNIIQSIKGGYSVKPGDLIEVFIYSLVSNSVLSAEILRKQFELEQLVREGSVDREKAADQTEKTLASITEKANAMKDSILADLHLKNQDDEDQTP